MLMKDFDKTEINIELSKRLKNVKRLIKYQEGYSKAPDKYQERIIKNIEYLQSKVHHNDLEYLYELKLELTKQLESIVKEEQSRTYIEHISIWYLRPLINHFDDSHKLGSLMSKTDGVSELRQKLQFFVPELYYQPEPEKTKKQLNQFYSFKAKGKGSPESRLLERQFYEQFEFTIENPIPKTTLGTLGLPLIHYNVPAFWNRVKAGSEAVLVTGVCPLSTIANELGFMLSDNKVVRPTLGFEESPIEYEDIVNIEFPNKPIISDYLILKNILDLYKSIRNNSKVSVIIWYPYHEYYLELTENLLKNYLAVGRIAKHQLIQGMDKIKKQYFNLLEYVKSELELKGEKVENDIKIIEVDIECYDELEKYKKNIDLSFFKYLYGSWVGNDLRRELYDRLIIKHIEPVFNGKNVLHFDTSYELWVDILGSIVVERFGLPGDFSWVNYPSVPSISLSFMREYNAPFDDKLFLAQDCNQFQVRVESLPRKYLLHVAPLLVDKDDLMNKNQNEIIDEFKTKLLKLNNFLQN